MLNEPRSLVAAMQVTLDGYILDAGDRSDWVDSWADGLGLLAEVDAFVLGAGMFPGYAEFWATMLDDPAAVTEWLGREPYERELAYARRAAQTRHLVVSTSLTEARWPTAELLRDISELRRFKAEVGNPGYVVGGPRLVVSLIAAGLLDHLRLIVHPIIVGAGRRLFDGLDQPVALEPLSAERADHGRIHLHYRLSG